MSAQIENRSIEAEIAECCQAIYWATDADVAMTKWSRLRKLMTEKSEAETRLFLRETMSCEMSQDA